MKTRVLPFAAAAALAAAMPAAAPAAAKSALDTARIEQLTGAKGQLDEKEGVFKVSVPRTDLQLTAAGVKIPPAMGLTSWAAFEGSPGHAMVSGLRAALDRTATRVGAR